MIEDRAHEHMGSLSVLDPSGRVGSIKNEAFEQPKCGGESSKHKSAARHHSSIELSTEVFRIDYERSLRTGDVCAASCRRSRRVNLPALVHSWHPRTIQASLTDGRWDSPLAFPRAIGPSITSASHPPIGIEQRPNAAWVIWGRGSFVCSRFTSGWCCPSGNTAASPISFFSKQGSIPSEMYPALGGDCCESGLATGSHG